MQLTRFFNATWAFVRKLWADWNLYLSTCMKMSVSKNFSFVLTEYIELEQSQ